MAVLTWMGCARGTRCPTAPTAGCATGGGGVRGWPCWHWPAMQWKPRAVGIYTLRRWHRQRARRTCGPTRATAIPRPGAAHRDPQGSACPDNGPGSQGARGASGYLPPPDTEGPGADHDWPTREPRSAVASAAGSLQITQAMAMGGMGASRFVVGNRPGTTLRQKNDL